MGLRGVKSALRYSTALAICLPVPRAFFAPCPFSSTYLPRHELSPQGKCVAMSSLPSTPMSQASTKFGLDSSIELDDNKSGRRHAIEGVKEVSVSQDILLFLVAFRILNALSIRTFFQPDEYFQSLEPAWQMAFGTDSGAWITWVCKSTTKP